MCVIGVSTVLDEVNILYRIKCVEFQDVHNYKLRS